MYPYLIWSSTSSVKKESLSFSELVELVSNELTRNALQESVKLAEKYNLSELTMKKITKEVKAVRYAKSHS